MNLKRLLKARFSQTVALSLGVLAMVFLIGLVVWAWTEPTQAPPGGNVSAPSVPSGAVMFFNASSCPAGWTELTSARGRAIIGLPAAGTLAGIKGTALSNLGTRTITDVPTHSHAVDPPNTNTSTAGEHSHSIPLGSTNYRAADGSGYPYGYKAYADPSWKSTYSAGSHYHNVDISQFSSGTTGLVSVDVTMPYIQLLVCVKN